MPKIRNWCPFNCLIFNVKMVREKKAWKIPRQWWKKWIIYYDIIKVINYVIILPKSLVLLSCCDLPIIRSTPRQYAAGQYAILISKWANGAIWLRIATSSVIGKITFSLVASYWNLFGGSWREPWWSETLWRDENGQENDQCKRMTIWDGIYHPLHVLN